MSFALFRLELQRATRNRRALFFAAVLPTVFFLVFTAGKQSGDLSGYKPSPFLMMSMATYGAMNALFTGGGIIAGERSIGWPRQLRIAGMGNRAYVTTKIAVSYLFALPGLVVVFILGGTVKHVHLSAGDWVLAGASILVTLLPVAALGVAIGYAARPQALQTIFGIGSTLLALMGGLLVPPSTFPSSIQDGMKAIPTYWAADAGREVLRSTWLGPEGIVILAGWLLGFAALAGWLFRRDALRPSAAGAT